MLHFVLLPFLLTSLLWNPSMGLELPKRTIEQINLLDFEAEEIQIIDNMTDFAIQFHSDFVCPIGAQCEITLEIQEMDCTKPEFDDHDPTYIWFYPITLLGDEEEAEADHTNTDREYKCEDFKGDERRRMRVLEAFDLTSAVIVPTGSKWETGLTSVRIFAKIIATKILTLDASMQDAEIRISGPLTHEIQLGDMDLDTCPAEECFYSILPILKTMDCTRVENALRITTFTKNGAMIEDQHICTMTSEPVHVVTPADGTIAMVRLAPTGDWRAEGAGAVVTLTLHVHPFSGSSCPSGYFNCGNCSSEEGTAPTACILNDFRCDKRPHCGLPCYADESEELCQRIGDRYIDTADLHDLYVFLLKLFLCTSTFTLLVVFWLTFLFFYKMNSVGQRSRRQGHPEQFVIDPLPPNYMTLAANLDKSIRIS